MSYTRPTLDTLISRVTADISGRTEGSAYIKRSVEAVLAKTSAGLSHGMHGHLDWVYRQISPVTCEIEGLRYWGAVIDMPQHVPTFAQLSLEFTGTESTEIPLDTSVQDDDGLTYTVTVAGTVTSGVATVTVTADTAGTASNLLVAAPVALVSPIAGIDTEGEVSASVITALDLEETEDYRARILGNLRVPPAGGGPGDYVTWAKEVAGVTRAWEFGNRMGYGTVSVAFVRDGDESIIPSSGEVAEVQAYIEAVMPLDVRALYVQAPVAKVVDIEVALLPNTAEVQAAVTAELEELFARVPELEAYMTESQISEAISLATGEDHHNLLSVSSLLPSTWEILTLGDITFSTYNPEAS